MRPPIKSERVIIQQARGEAMMIYERLSRAEERIFGEWRASQPAEAATLLRLWAEVHFFIWRTGQIHRFEDYLERPGAERSVGRRGAAWDGEQGEQVIRVREILGRIRDAQQSAEHRELVQVGLDEIDFLSSSGQQDELYDYLKTYYRNPPPVIARFATREAAETWWTQHPHPPISAWVQIAGEHHLAIHHRKIAHRTLHPISILKGWEEEKKRMDQRAQAQQAEDTADTED